MSAQATAARPRLTLREIVLIVVLGVVFGFLYWVFVQAWNGLAVAMGPAGDLAQHVLFGSWLLVAPIALAILRRPGVGILAEILAAVIEVVFLGSPVGPLLILSAFLQGLGSEIPFALFRYRRFGWGVFAASGALGAGMVFFWTAYRAGWYGQDLLMLRLGVQVASGIVLGGLLARVIVDALERTGVLANFAIGTAAGTSTAEFERTLGTGTGTTSTSTDPIAATDPATGGIDHGRLTTSTRPADGR